ncbi:hypothetical protein BT69DRAFT_1349404 [Atractiella rhizophila]|nr:hypothetical protein BT69DRAFT_1349404 [Atractiella rhizophila]
MNSESYKQKASITAILKSILGSYPYSIGILRELLQNSEDAGATTQRFILDHDRYPTNTLYDPALARFQGPALVAINDSVFEPKDWESLSDIAKSSKTDDNTKAGKFGLGFRSCYHVTDAPFILSVSHVAGFDPHEEMTGNKAGGFRITLSEARSKYQDQMSAFTPFVENCMDYFPSTIIRLPLRTSAEGERSEVSDNVVEPKDVTELFKAFISTEIQLVLLFFKHIRKVEILDWKKGKMKLLASAEKIPTASEDGSATFRIDIVTSFKRETSSTSDSWSKFVFDPTVDDNLLAHLRNKIKFLYGEDWKISKLMDTVQRQKLHSRLDLALPNNLSVTERLDFKSKLFALLPFPTTFDGFIGHVNAAFALTPSRQSLKNEEEKCSGKSLDAFLVGWNYTIFEYILPRATRNAILSLLQSPGAVLYDYLPSPVDMTSTRRYFQTILQDTLNLLIESQDAVWPVFANERRISLEAGFIQCAASLACSTAQEEARALTDAGMSIISIPALFYSAVKSAMAARCKEMTPDAISKALRTDPACLEPLSPENKSLILRYLTSDGTIERTFDLPLYYLKSESYAAISPTSRPYFIATKQECQVFADFGDQLILQNHLPESLLQLRHSKLAMLSSQQALQFTKKRLGHYLFSKTDGIDVGPELWQWVGTIFAALDKRHDLPFEEIKDLPLLPTTDGRLRKVRSGAILKSSGDLTEVIAAIGVPVTETRSKTLQRCGGNLNMESDRALRLVLSARDPTLIPIGSRKSFHEYFGRLVPKIDLDPTEVASLKRFPIFLVIINQGGQLLQRFAALTAQVTVLVQSPTFVPTVDGRKIVFVEESDNSKSILDTLRSVDPVERWTELELLLEGLRSFNRQHLRNYQHLFERWLARLADLENIEKGCRTMIRQCRGIPKANRDGGLHDPPGYLMPSEVVPRNSPVAQLFLANEYVFAERALDSLIAKLDRENFLISFDSSLVRHRVDILSNGVDPLRVTTFLQLLDSNLPAGLSDFDFDKPWLAARKYDEKVYQGCKPSQCRDSEDRYLFDRVLPIVDYNIRNLRLRTLFGWLDLSVDILACQLVKLANEGNANFERISIVIQSLHEKWRSDPSISLRLRSNLHGLAWIPTSDSDRTLQRADRITFSGHDLRPAYYWPFASLNPSRDMLEALGVADPEPEQLAKGLVHLANPDSQFSVGVSPVSRAIALLSAITSLLPPEKLTLIELLVPDVDGIFRQRSQICYDDSISRRGKILPPTGYFAAHKGISRDLADKLLLHDLTRLLNEEDGLYDFAEEFGQHEDISTRIRSNLKGCTATTWLLEALSNADDAKATKVSFVLDEVVSSTSDFAYLAPGLGGECAAPSLLVYNDSVFKEKDWLGIRRVGIGGKEGESATIGRFGLGALSMFYYSNFPLIVSNEHLTLLDPTGTALPRHGESAHPKGIRLPLTRATKYCSGHLKDLDSLPFGFLLSESFNGTIFRLPLRTESSHKQLKDEALSLPEVKEVLRDQAFGEIGRLLFMQNVKLVESYHRLRNGHLQLLWRIQVEKPIPVRPTLCEFLRIRLTLPNGEEHEEQWTVSQVSENPQDAPDKFRILFLPYALHKARTPSVAVGFCPSSSILQTSGLRANSRLHAVLPLASPSTLSLPVEISGTFILTPERRTIRLEESVEGRYNRWLLEELVPRAYHRLIAGFNLQALSKPQRVPRSSIWPRRKPDCDASKLIWDGFYKNLETCDQPIFVTMKQEVVTPKMALLPFSGDPKVTCFLHLLGTEHVVGMLPFLRNSLTSETWNMLRTDRAEFVREQVLLNRTTTTAQLWADRILTASILAAVTVHLLNSKVPLDIPLVPCEDNHLNVVSGRRCPLLYRTPNSVACLKELFPDFLVKEDFLIELESRGIKRSACGLQPATAEHLAQLVRHKFTTKPSRIWNDASKVQWLEKFWRTVAPSVSLRWDHETLLDCPVIPLVAKYNVYQSISPRQFRTSAVLPRLPTTEDPDFRRALEQDPNISIVSIDLQLADRFSVSLMDCLSQMVPAARNALSQSLAQTIRNWISFRDLGSSMSRFTSLIQELPLWPGLFQHDKLLTENESVVISSRVVHLDKFARFFSSTVKFAEYDDYLKGKVIQPSQIAQYLRLPNPDGITNDRELEDYIEFLTEMRRVFERGLEQALQDVPYLPNGNGVLRAPSSLLSHTNVLFNLIYATNADQKDKFLHRRIRTLNARPFIPLGVQTQINNYNILSLLEEFNRHVWRSEQPHQQEASRSLYAALSDNGACNPSWSKVRHLRFIPSKESARMRAFGSCLNGAGPIRSLVCAPEELMLDSYQTIAWTQRNLFQTEPSTNLRQRYPDLGCPSLIEVLQHLVVLTSILAPCIFSSTARTDLMKDIFACYDYLEENVDEAREYLDSITDQAVFLNVDSTDDEWTFVKGTELVFRLRHDSETTGQRRVGDKLMSYGKLLEACGATILRRPEYIQRETTSPVFRDTSFQTLRNQGILTDISFQTADGKQLHAHKVILLANAYQRFQFLQDPDWMESQDRSATELPFDAEVTQLALEYIYSCLPGQEGTLPQFRQPVNDSDRSQENAMLHELVQLIKLSDFWELDALKEHAARTICKFDFVAPDTVAWILTTARDYRCQSLEDYCMEYQDLNRHTGVEMDELESEEEES